MRIFKCETTWSVSFFFSACFFFSLCWCCRSGWGLIPSWEDVNPVRDGNAPSGRQRQKTTRKQVELEWGRNKKNWRLTSSRSSFFFLSVDSLFIFFCFGRPFVIMCYPGEMLCFWTRRTASSGFYNSEERETNKQNWIYRAIFSLTFFFNMTLTLNVMLVFLASTKSTMIFMHRETVITLTTDDIPSCRTVVALREMWSFLVLFLRPLIHREREAECFCSHLLLEFHLVSPLLGILFL